MGTSRRIGKASAHLGWLLVCWGVVLAGCGGGDGDEKHMTSCPPFTACGGELEGTWDLEEVCLDADWADIAGIEQPECADAIADVRYLPDATLEVTASTMELTGDFMFEMDMVLTETCVQALADDPSVRVDAALCDRLQTGLNEPDPDASIESATCTFLSNACHCTASSGVIAGMMGSLGSGTYRIEGNAYVADSGERIRYCVQEDELTVEGDLMGASGLMTLRRR